MLGALNDFEGLALWDLFGRKGVVLVEPSRVVHVEALERRPGLFPPPARDTQNMVPLSGGGAVTSRTAAVFRVKGPDYCESLEED